MNQIRYLPVHCRELLRSCIYLVALTMPVVLLSGCGSGMATVEGNVVWQDGTPAKELQGSYVVFENPKLDVSARGPIQPDGTFRLTTDKPDDGVPPGDYKVLIFEVGRKALGGPDSSQMEPSRMHSRYMDLEATDLTAEVKPGVNPITLKIERNKQK
jgi:hypothetical protein